MGTPTSEGPLSDEYEVLSALPGTATCDLLLVRSTRHEQPLVLKVLQATYTADAEAFGRFIDEAGLCQRLQHANLLQSHGAGRLPDGRYYFATELLEGMTLSEHLRFHGPLSPEALIALLEPVCDALAWLHEHGVVHRDLRPESIFLVGGLSAFAPKLVDFARAQARGTRTYETLPGATTLRADYSAPECIRGHQADARSDLYALGCVIFEALTGHRPFGDASHSKVLDRQLNDPPPPLPAGVRHLAGLLNRCLAKEPFSRFQSALELKAALSEFGQLPARGPSRTAPLTTAFAHPPEDVGDVLGSYQLLRLLGEGSMGRVFLARHTTLDRRVAIKILRPEQALRKDLVERFFQEARLVNRINHDHIVEIHDFVDSQRSDGQRASYCVMELLDGLALRALADQEHLSVTRIAGVMRQVCAALQAAHSVGVIHRDVKPDNIVIVQREGRDFAKVLDFGVAKLERQTEEELISKTLAGLIIGTPTYMSPEQIAGREVDAHADVYSVGVVLYELLAGRAPFLAPGFLQLALQIGSELPPPLPDLTARGEVLPVALKAVVIRCLEKDPAKRFQSMEALAQALAPFDWHDGPLLLTTPAQPFSASRTDQYGVASGAFHEGDFAPSARRSGTSHTALVVDAAPAMGASAPLQTDNPATSDTWISTPESVAALALNPRRARRRWVALGTAAAASLLVGWGLVTWVGPAEGKAGAVARAQKSPAHPVHVVAANTVDEPMTFSPPPLVEALPRPGPAQPGSDRGGTWLTRPASVGALHSEGVHAGAAGHPAVARPATAGSARTPAIPTAAQRSQKGPAVKVRTGANRDDVLDPYAE